MNRLTVLRKLYVYYVETKHSVNSNSRLLFHLLIIRLQKWKSLMHEIIKNIISVFRPIDKLHF